MEPLSCLCATFPCPQLLPATLLVPLGHFLRQHCCQSQLSSSAASQLSVPPLGSARPHPHPRSRDRHAAALWDEQQPYGAAEGTGQPRGSSAPSRMAMCNAGSELCRWLGKLPSHQPSQHPSIECDTVSSGPHSSAPAMHFWGGGRSVCCHPPTCGAQRVAWSIRAFAKPDVFLPEAPAVKPEILQPGSSDKICAFRAAFAEAE